MAQKFEIMPPRNAERVLLHCCCAPCSSAIVEALFERNIEPVLYYYNPNIFPEAEYLKRKDECMRFAKIKGLACVDADYDHGSWLAKISSTPSKNVCTPLCMALMTHFFSKGRYASTLALLISLLRALWCFAHVPVMRAGRILPLSVI